MSDSCVNPKSLTSYQDEVVNVPSPLVSVIIPTYMHENYIAQALKSVLDQKTTFAVEVLVGEDCSSDATLERIKAVMEANPGRITLHAHSKNMGGHENFEYLWNRCQGKYIAWVEGDDFWTDPYKLQKQADCLEQDGNLTFCFHNTAPLNQETQELGPVYPNLGDAPRRVGLKQFLFANRAHTCSVMYRAGILQGFPQWIYPLSIGDWPMHIMHALHGDGMYLPDCMASYRIHSGGVWSHQPFAFRVERSIVALEAVRDNIDAVYYLDCTKAILLLKADLALFQSGHGASSGAIRLLDEYRNRWTSPCHDDANEVTSAHHESKNDILYNLSLAIEDLFVALILNEAGKNGLRRQVEPEHPRLRVIEALLQMIKASRWCRVLRAYAGLPELPLVRLFLRLLKPFSG